ncbi:THAP domain-containing protein [Phthorimaea operculella]|nr:THAP domain-containing protein [Phthorimaea operculella]
MPYYCTVPRCTSMAGKAKNVSFHQFPRDEELARLWNRILKRGKPYTKYSKVCSLHFRPEDYTITSVGKNKGQWRTLRKDAIPSQNLPSESPGPVTHRSRSSGSWGPSLPPNVIDTRVQQQMAQAIYMQTMLAMQAATNGTPSLPVPSSVSSSIANTSNPPISEIEKLLQMTQNGNHRLYETEEDQEVRSLKLEGHTSYKCEECSKCFKDPDVFVLHRRTHAKKDQEKILSVVEKENLNANSTNKQETLRANPILANLLKSGMSSDIQEQLPNVFDTNNILSIENQIMTALAANMESYIRNLSTMLGQTAKDQNGYSDSENQYDDDENSDSNEQNNENHTDDRNGTEDVCLNKLVADNLNTNQDVNEKDVTDVEMSLKEEAVTDPVCDKKDLNDSKDSNSLVIDESM